MTTEISPVPARVLSPFEADGAGEIRVDSHDLAKDEDVDALVGIDFRITSITYRPGLARVPGSLLEKNGGYGYGGYISAEIETNPEQQLNVVNRRRRASGLPVLATLEGLPFEPGELFVFNDGSTGIYRRITALLAEEGYITLPKGKLTGKSGDSVLDTIPPEWLGIDEKRGAYTDEDPAFYTTSAIKIRCLKGIRISMYEYAKGHEAITRYI